MATINIRSDVKDPFYRYKMEKLQSKIEGKGNGIKTVIVNLSSVANSLARPGAYVIKYFGFELGAQTNSNPADDRWIINGAHEASKLQDYLDGFINKFVLCKKCKNPETEVVIKDGHIVLDCKACGQRSDVDLRLKLSGFILKNQPKTGKKNKADKKAARKAKQNGNANGDENGHNSGSEGNSENGSNENGDVDVEAGSDDELTRRINDGALELDEAVEVKDDEWTVDMSPEAVRARQQQLPDDLKQKLVLGDDEDEDGEGGGNSAYDQLGNWITSEAEAKGGVSNVEDVAIYLKAKEYGIEAKHRTLLVLVQTIFDDKIVKQIPARSSMLKNMVTSEKHQKALLGGVERFIGLRGQNDAKFYDETPKVLMALYNEDILPEDVLTKWGTKASKKYIDLPTSKKVRKSAEVFLNWLAEAESDDDSE
ncbi:putative eukaryotic translation initiation factor 5 [Leptodontidium sp. 2 PMI_412]|nr:putative eukaryotic translation initiation factor 5 [Leptodontidium sp. MPI-SDFR-AT-0119]KAH9219851.1 putative eukaryotic translation initiation factor 5 [Leptodontidium sp. 2 PMI_412]